MFEKQGQLSSIVLMSVAGLAIALIALVGGVFLGSMLGKRPAPADPYNLDQYATQAALTQVAGITPVILTPTQQPGDLASPTQTPLPTETETPTATHTALPTSTTPPTSTPRPSATATPTATALPLDWAVFIKDITIPDGTHLSPGESFTKVWRLRNGGSRTWTKDYDLVFISGERMTDLRAIPLTASVVSGATIDVRLTLTAPEKPGTFRGRWMLRNKNGGIFGIGTEGNMPIFVEIVVDDPEAIAYDFAAQVCDAGWSTKTGGKIPCPGVVSDPNGYIVGSGSAILEGGLLTNVPSLLLAPEAQARGAIAGIYPALKIEKGDLFLAAVACQNGQPRCNLRFQLDYRIGSGSLQPLGAWQEASEGLSRTIQIDLSALAGKEVSLILWAKAGESALDDHGVWIHPRILRK